MAENGGNKGRKKPPQQPGKGGPRKGGKISQTIILWVLLIFISVMAYKYFGSSLEEESKVSYSEFMRLLKAGRIKNATITNVKFHGVLKSGKKILVNLGTVDSELKEKLGKYGVEFSFKEGKKWSDILLSILPWVLFIGIWFWLMRRMQSGPKRVFSFGKSKAKAFIKEKPKVYFKDVAGAEEAKEELQELIEFLKNPERFQQLGGRIPKGNLLVGPPGTGKTLLARAVAGEADVPFFSISGSDFVEMFVGVGASRVRDLFEQSKANAPCIVFIDEIDAVGRQRGAGIGGGHDEREQTLNQLLSEMDGFEANEGVIIIAATNRPDVLDPALLRPGRFDRQVIIQSPDVREREEILKVHTRKVPMEEDVNLKTIARGTPGMSGADLENIVNESALLASRQHKKKVSMADLEEAKDKVMMGVERKSLVLSHEDKRNIAYHEAGHALMSKLVPRSDSVHKVTIIPRGRALGLTHFLPLDERYNRPKNYWLDKLVHLLGGRAAEKLILNDITTGGANDIEQATSLARKMVCDWGMSEKLGPLTFGKKQEEIFLGREIAKHRDYSEKVAVAIDEEVESLVKTAEKKALDLLKGNMDKLHALANALLEHETLNEEQIEQVLKKEGKFKPAQEKEPKDKVKVSN